MENVQSIMERGLIPQIGERSKEQGEEKPTIFLFPTKDDMDDSLSNWLGAWYEDSYGPDVELAVIKVSVPNDIFVHYAPHVSYECYVTESVPPKQLFFYTEHGEPLRRPLDCTISDALGRATADNSGSQFCLKSEFHR